MSTERPSERHADIDGVAMPWLDWGAGKPVVLLRREQREAHRSQLAVNPPGAS